MKHNTLKRILSLLLVICMMASFAGCIPGEEDPTEPSTIETTGYTESTIAPTDGTTAPIDSTDVTTSPTEKTQEPTTPTEAETNPPATETPNTDPTFATEVPTECEHTMGAWTVAKEATCEETGEKTRVCTKDYS